MPDSVLDFLRTWAFKEPHRDFIRESLDEALTYGEAWTLITTLLPQRLETLIPQRSLESLPVMIISPNSTLSILCMFSLWYMGSRTVLASARSEPVLWAGMIERSESEVVIAPLSLHPRIKEAFTLLEKRSPPLLLDIEELIPEEHQNVIPQNIRQSNYTNACRNWVLKNIWHVDLLSKAFRFSRNLPAATLFTSSAINVQTLKSVTYTHSMLVDASDRTLSLIGGDEYARTAQRHLGTLPLSHCYELCYTLCTNILRTGGTYIIFDRTVSSPHLPMTASLAEIFLQALHCFSPITSFATVPGILSSIITKASEEDINLLRKMQGLTIGGASCPQSISTWLTSHGIRFLDGYGSTELLGAACSRSGKNLGGVDDGFEVQEGLMGYIILDDPNDTFGELVICSDNLPRSYDNNPSDDFSYDAGSGTCTYRTNDLFSFKKDLPHTTVLRSNMGNQTFPVYDPSLPRLRGLKYLGRMGDMIALSNGYNINALSIETALDNQPGITRSAVLPTFDGNSIMALLQPKPKLKLLAEDAKNLVANVNASHPVNQRVPLQNIYVVEELPVTTKQTLHRKKLRLILEGAASPDDIFARLGRVSDEITITKEQERPHPSKAKEGIIINRGILTKIAEALAEVLDLPSTIFLDVSLDLASQSLSSLAIVKFAKIIKGHFSIELLPAQIYGMKTVGDICTAVETSLRVGGSNSKVLDHVVDSVLTQNAIGEEFSKDVLSITGVSCRLPGDVRNISDIWEALCSPELHKRRCNTPRPLSRWTTKDISENKVFPSNWLEIDLNAIDHFATFFNLTPNEVRSMTPNARISLLLGYEAIQNSGIAPKSLGGKSWGVFTAVNDSGWRERRSRKLDIEEYAKEAAGYTDDSVGARLSYFLDLTGPAMDIKTACSSSTVAVHQACSAIKEGDCDAAIVISCMTQFHPTASVFRAKSNIVSPSGVCRPFSAFSDGYVASEGAVAIVIQKASDAVVEPYCHIRGSSVAQDGRSHGFYAPNPVSQIKVIRAALKKAKCAPSDITYLEAHGTGTSVGDGIELKAIGEVFGDNISTPLLVGSSKAVFGHTEETAGLIGLLKVIACLKYQSVPAQPIFGLPNPMLAISPMIRIPSKSLPLAPGNSGSLLCGISSFGLSGTLAHIIVEEVKPTLSQTPMYQAKRSPGEELIFVVSARNEEDWSLNITNYLNFFMGSDLEKMDIRAVCRLSVLGRDSFQIRKGWRVDSWEDIIGSLQAAIKVPIPNGIRSGSGQSQSQKPRIGIWFGMIKNNSSWLLDTLYPTPTTSERRESVSSFLIDQIRFAEYINRLGGEISVVGGEGPGELAAGIFAGTVPVSCLELSSSSSSSSTSSTGGESEHEYALVNCSEEALWNELALWREDELTISGQLSSNTYLLRGTNESIDSLVSLDDTQFTVLERGIEVPTTTDLGLKLSLSLSPSPSLSSESSDVDAIPVPLLPQPQLRLDAPRIPIISAHLGEELTSTHWEETDYWDNISSKKFRTDLAMEMMRSRCDVIIHLGKYHSGSYVDSVGKVNVKEDTRVLQSDSVGQVLLDLFEMGCSIDWSTYFGGSEGISGQIRERERIPPYAFVGSPV